MRLGVGMYASYDLKGIPETDAFLLVQGRGGDCNGTAETATTANKSRMTARLLLGNEVYSFANSLTG